MLALAIFLVVLASAKMVKIHSMGSIMKMKNERINYKFQKLFHLDGLNISYV
jgi:hypothetical protein